MEKINIKHNKAENRFETEVDGHLGVVEYRMLRGKIALVHTGVPEEISSQGIAAQLAKFALEYAKENALLVLPYCPYINTYIKRHPEYQALVDPKFDS